MKYDALKHQGSKGDKNTADIVGEKAGDSGRTVQLLSCPESAVYSRMF